jgi:hypothetical protein
MPLSNNISAISSWLFDIGKRFKTKEHTNKIIFGTFTDKSE